jgi:hypothetical protein
VTQVVSRDAGPDYGRLVTTGRGAMRPLPFSADYGAVGSAYDPPKMSVFPNVAGQSLLGAGAVGCVVDAPVRKLYNACR